MLTAHTLAPCVSMNVAAVERLKPRAFLDELSKLTSHTKHREASLKLIRQLKWD